MKARKQKTERQKLVAELDRVHSLFIRKRDKRCVICGTSERLTCGHIFTRTSYSTRWDITPDGNAHGQCAGCNFRHEHDFYPFSRWYMSKFGLDSYAALHKRHKEVRKYKNYELQEMIDEIEQALAEDN